MSYAQLDFAAARTRSGNKNQGASQSQAETAAMSRRRAIDALYRALSRLAGAAANDWRHCGKAACLRSRRCRGQACERYVCARRAGERKVCA